jgi:hypothetical protein
MIRLLCIKTRPPRPEPPPLRAFPRRLLFLFLALILAPLPSSAQGKPTLTWTGEIRPRLYAREPVGGEWDHWISMRTRLALDARFQEGMGLFFQVQDVRAWGEETSNRDRSADAVDFHQAYLEVEDVPGVGGLIRAGRQEVGLGENRLISAPDWGQAGQSFDGVRYSRPAVGGQLDLVYLRLQEGSSDAHDGSADFMSAWLALPVQELGSLEFLAIHDRSEGFLDHRRSTVGSIVKAASGPLSAKLQGMYQFGTRWETDLSAFMIAAHTTLSLAEGKGSITLWYDHLSGNERGDDLEDGAFSTLFGAQHRFFGRGDYFRNIPEDTQGLGLQDAALKLTVSPSPLLRLNLDLHTFRTTEAGALSSQHLADEVDFWAKYQFRHAMALEAGYSLTLGGTAMEELGRLDGNGNMIYFMTSLLF